MKFGVDYAHNTGNQHYRRSKWNSCHKEFRRGIDAMQNTSHHPREYLSGSWPYWRRLSAYCGWNLSGAWYAHQLWERAVHHQKRAAVSKNFGPMGTQIVEWSTKNCSVQISKTMLARYEKEGDTFIHRIVTCDETWVHHYTPKTKRASKQWWG